MSGLFDIGLKAVLKEQLDLDALCADRQLETEEIFPPNAYYGIDRILKEYAGLSARYPLKAVVPHGPYLSNTVLWEAEQSAAVPAVFSYPAYRIPLYLDRTSKLVIPAASPYLYLLELLADVERPKRSGTLFFPYHSTHHVTTNSDFGDLADRLTRLPAHLHPVTVCIYWRDYNLGRHRVFEERGIRVVSAGHMFDPLFLVRFHHLCTTHRYAAGNHVGSHLFYSVASGCAYFQMEEGEYTFDAKGSVLERDLWENSAEVDVGLSRAFRHPVEELSSEQRSLVSTFLGAESLQPPSHLRAELDRCEWLDRAGFVIRNEGAPRKLVIPPYYPRNLKRGVHRLLRRR